MSDETPANTAIAFIGGLKQAVAEILHAEKAGISEYALISRLDAYPALAKFLRRAPADTLALFRIHFLLHHVLYVLRQEWHTDQSACLEISALHIQKQPYKGGADAITAFTATDKLRDYYLDLNNLLTTGEQQVDELMAAFWIGINHREHRDAALAVLGLQDPVDDDTIRKTYRGLVMAHHPDRGGDHETIQQLNDAAQGLLKTNTKVM
ncbi:MAG: DNA-J related domain-containing protein [Gammaproteobacteria bacterium]